MEPHKRNDKDHLAESDGRLGYFGVGSLFHSYTAISHLKMISILKMLINK